MRIIEALRIWDRAPHCAFTDLAHHHGRWYCTFREAGTHVSGDGKLRVIASSDAVRWVSVALIGEPEADLRDPKLTIHPNGQLMLSAACVPHDRTQGALQSVVWLSGNGVDWGNRQVIGDDDFWLWRLSWNAGRAYAIGYSCTEDKSIRLYSSEDGLRFTPLVDRLFDTGYPNETALVFRGNTAFCLLRRDGQPDSGLIGQATLPFMKWTWRELGVRLGGPQMLILDDGSLLAAVRLYDGRVRTSLCVVEPEAGRLTELLVLPSGGDTSYAGMVLRDGLLWISYYSSHEGRTAIYLAKVDPEMPA